MTEREALKLTLAALKQIDEAMPFPVAKLAIMEAEKALAQPEFVLNGIDCSCGRKWRVVNNTLTASAQPEQEPYKGIAEHLNQATNGRVRIDPVTGDFGFGTVTQPEQKPVATEQSEEREWVGLTDEEVKNFQHSHWVSPVATRAIEDKIKGKNMK